MKSFSWVMVLTFSPLILAITGSCGQSTPQIGQQSAAARVNMDIRVHAKEIPLILGDVLRGTDLSGGVAEQIDCSGLPTAQLDVKQGISVQEAMGSFVAENPRYRWREDRNVVNVVPIADLPLLNTKISSFELETAGTTTARDVLNGLIGLPQIRQRAAELNLKSGLMQGWLETLPTQTDREKIPAPIRLSLHDVSLQEAFNSVVRLYGATIWIYEEHQCNGERTYVVRASAE
jgi:hypothetical protein